MIRKPCSLYATFGRCGFDSSQVRHASSKVKGFARLPAAWVPKILQPSASTLVLPTPTARGPSSPNCPQSSVLKVSPPSAPIPSKDAPSNLSQVAASSAELRATVLANQRTLSSAASQRSTGNSDRRSGITSRQSSTIDFVQTSASSIQNWRSTLEDDQPIHRVLPHVIYPGDTQLLRLPSGRDLCYSISGSTKNYRENWLLIGGTPHSRLDFPSIVPKWADSHGKRLIRPERPGYGHSTFVKDYTLLDIARDIEYLLDYLDIQKFKIYAASGGAPYAVACAYHFSKKRLLKTAIMCGNGHPAARRAGTYPRRMMIMAWANLSPSTYVWWNNYKRARRIGTMLSSPEDSESYRQGWKGHVYDLKCNDRLSSWEFDLKDVDANEIRMYHGDADLNAPYSGAQYYRNHLKGSTLKKGAGDDHYTMQNRYFWESFEWLGS